MVSIFMQYNKLNIKNTIKAPLQLPHSNKKYTELFLKRSINAIKRLFFYFIATYINRLNKCKYIQYNELNAKNGYFLQEFQKRLIIVQTIEIYRLI